MDYLLIDQDSELHHRSADDYTTALDDCGPEGWNRIQLTRDLAAFVNDASLIMPKYHRNVTGGLVLMALGAHRMPYAGPIVLTGWDGAATHQDRAEVTGLTPMQVGLVHVVYDMVTASRPPTGSPRRCYASESWSPLEIATSADEYYAITPTPELAEMLAWHAELSSDLDRKD